MRVFMFAICALAACARPADAPDVSHHVEDVIAAERAFAADAGRIGWVEAFEAFAAPDAIVLQDGPANAHEFLEAIDPANRGDLTLNWAPTFAGAASSGDLGFTTGPFNGGDAAFGYYFTVWRRQPDGAWKWIYDGGVDVRAPLAPNPGGQVIIASPRGAAGSAEAAKAEVLRAEAELAQAAAEDAAPAFAGVLMPSMRLNRQNEVSAEGAPAAIALLAKGPARINFTLLRADASSAGDVVFTLGEARWNGGSGYYTRIWLRETAGWRLAFDQIVERSLHTQTPPG